MRNAVFLGKAAGINQTPRSFLCVTQSESKVDARLSGWLDLSKDMIAVKRHDRLARTGLNVVAHARSEFQQRTVNWTQVFLLARKHVLDILFRCLQISVCVAELFTFANRPFSQPPR